jgi:plasmid stability protein
LWLYNGGVNLTIKNIPDTVCEELKRTAAEHRRSLNAEVIEVLAAQAAEITRRRAMRDSRKELERFVVRLPKLSDSTPLIREDRNR